MTMPTMFVPHGGGPCFFMDPEGGPPDPMWGPMQAYLAGLLASTPERPRAILIVSGHWEAERPTVNVGDGQPLDFDYHGFPEHTYRLRYDAPGAPATARRTADLLRAAGVEADETARGWDHGVFIPLMVAAPDADLPVAQLSLVRGGSAAEHLAIGRALAPLRDEGVLIVGSGMSFHKLRVRGAPATARSAEWDAALTAAATDPDPGVRAERIARWEELPHARFAHPEAEHLMPLMVALGAGGDGPATRDYADTVLGWRVSGYRFG